MSDLTADELQRRLSAFGISTWATNNKTAGGMFLYQAMGTLEEWAALLAQGQAPPQGVTVEPLLRYAQAQAKCPCCGQSSECTPECTLADDDIEAWSAVDNARSVVAVALGAGKGEAAGGNA